MKNFGAIPEHEIHSGAPITEAVRHMVSFFKWRFSKHPVGAYHYDLEEGAESASEIFIGAETPIEVERVGKRPAITVLRSQAAFSGIGLGNLAYVDLATGAEVYMDLLPTTLTVACLSNTPVVSESLGWYCATQVRAFWKPIVRASNGLFLTTGQQISISPISPAGALVNDTTGDWTAVVLGIPVYLQHSVTRMPLNQITLEDFDLRLRST